MLLTAESGHNRTHALQQTLRKKVGFDRGLKKIFARLAIFRIAAGGRRLVLRR
jgi:hypothetical protein